MNEGLDQSHTNTLMPSEEEADEGKGRRWETGSGLDRKSGYEEKEGAVDGRCRVSIHYEVEGDQGNGRKIEEEAKTGVVQ